MDVRKAEVETTKNRNPDLAVNFTEKLQREFTVNDTIVATMNANPFPALGERCMNSIEPAATII